MSLEGLSFVKTFAIFGIIYAAEPLLQNMTKILCLRWLTVDIYKLISKRTGTSLDDGARRTNTQIWSNKNRTQTILRALQSSSDVPVLLLNQPIFNYKPM